MNCLLGQPNQFENKVQTGGIIDVATRINIYTNAYRARFIETIETDHPILGSYLGDELFDQMVDGYIRTNPSHFTSLRQYADQLPKYLAANEPFSSHPVIAELARFERCLLSSFDAQDSETIKFETLTSLAPEKWPEVKCRFHPGLQIFRTEWNSVEIWRALKNQQQPEPAQASHHLNWLTWRNADRLTQFRSIDLIELSMLQGFLKGHDFSQICENLTQYLLADEVPTRAVEILKVWFDNNLIKSF